jgi:hypothetical protein
MDKPPRSTCHRKPPAPSVSRQRAKAGFDPGLIDELRKLDLAPPCPSAVRTCHNYPGIIEQDFEIQIIRRIIVRRGGRSPPQRQAPFGER